MASIRDIQFTGVLEGYQLKDPGTIASDSFGQSVRFQFEGKYANHKLFSPIKNGMLHGNAQIKDEQGNLLYSFQIINNCVVVPNTASTAGNQEAGGNFLGASFLNIPSDPNDIHSSGSFLHSSFMSSGTNFPQLNSIRIDLPQPIEVTEPSTLLMSSSFRLPNIESIADSESDSQECPPPLPSFNDINKVGEKQGNGVIDDVKPIFMNSYFARKEAQKVGGSQPLEKIGDDEDIGARLERIGDGGSNVPLEKIGDDDEFKVSLEKIGDDDEFKVSLEKIGDDDEFKMSLEMIDDEFRARLETIGDGGLNAPLEKIGDDEFRTSLDKIGDDDEFRTPLDKIGDGGFEKIDGGDLEKIGDGGFEKIDGGDLEKIGDGDLEKINGGFEKIDGGDIEKIGDGGFEKIGDGAPLEMIDEFGARLDSIGDGAPLEMIDEFGARLDSIGDGAPLEMIDEFGARLDSIGDGGFNAPHDSIDDGGFKTPLDKIGDDADFYVPLDVICDENNYDNRPLDQAISAMSTFNDPLSIQSAVSAVSRETVTSTISQPPPMIPDPPMNRSVNRGPVMINGLIAEGAVNQYGLQGEGRLFFKNHFLYKTGYFVNSKLNGSGIVFWDPESVKKSSLFLNQQQSKNVHFIGTFVNDVLHGKGKEYDAMDNLVYDGDFANGLYEGKGLFNYEKYTYEGEFRNGKKHGMGKLYRDIKDLVEEGEFKDDLLVRGVKYESGFKVTEGEYENGDLVKGKYYYPKTNIVYYEGTFLNNKPHGLARAYTPQGELNFQAEYDNGEVSGLIEYYYPDGSIKSSAVISNGIKNGEFKEFSSESSLSVSTFFVNDVEHGERRIVLAPDYVRVLTVENGTPSPNEVHYHKDRVIFKGVYHQGAYYTGEYMTYKETLSELICFKCLLENGVPRPVMETFVTSNLSAEDVDSTWKKVYEGGYVERNGDFLRNGDGAFSTGLKSIFCKWRENAIDGNATVVEEKLPQTKRRNAKFVGSVYFDASKSYLQPVIRYQTGIYTYEDGSLFQGTWKEYDVTVNNNVIYWPDGTTKYQIERVIKYDINQTDYAHEYMPYGLVNFFPKGHRVLVRGFFEPKFNCLGSPISMYESSTKALLFSNIQPQYSMNIDGYNVDYGYPQGYWIVCYKFADAIFRNKLVVYLIIESLPKNGRPAIL